MRRIILKGGPVDGTLCEHNGDGDVLYHQTSSTLLRPDCNILNPDGTWNNDAFAGSSWEFHKYQNTNNFEDVKGIKREAFAYVETTTRQDLIE
jgi:hypothetical protein